MRITINGTHKRVDRDTIRKALQWYARDLMPKMHSKIKLEVDIINGLQKNEGVLGGTAWIGKHRRPKHLLIEIDASICLKRTLSILAHEMVHVKQFATGQMVDLQVANAVSWHGKRYPVADDDRYWTMPWEIEAYGREHGLYHRFRRDCKI